MGQQVAGCWRWTFRWIRALSIAEQLRSVLEVFAAFLFRFHWRDGHPSGPRGSVAAFPWVRFGLFSYAGLYRLRSLRAPCWWARILCKPLLVVFVSVVRWARAGPVQLEGFGVGEPLGFCLPGQASVWGGGPQSPPMRVSAQLMHSRRQWCVWSFSSVDDHAGLDAVRISLGFYKSGGISPGL
ncbi:hypothetical protein Ancab_002384 [Ancistrocladus abbreviatus]